MYFINENAYLFESIIHTNGIFDTSIDAAYIIHLVNNSRYEHVKQELDTYKLSKQTYILHNKGYKYKNNEFINTPPLDLVDAFLTIFKHSKNNNYKNILILEDDFIFDKKILKQYIHTDINNFIVSKKNEAFIYYLGCMPFSIKKYKGNHWKRLISIGAHAIIYTQNYIDNVLNVDQMKIDDWDSFIGNNVEPGYMYHQPLCYQTHSKTENFKHWRILFIEKSSLMQDLVSKFFTLVKLDKEPKYIFNFMYKIMCIIS